MYSDVICYLVHSCARPMVTSQCYLNESRCFMRLEVPRTHYPHVYHDLLLAASWRGFRTTREASHRTHQRSAHPRQSLPDAGHNVNTHKQSHIYSLEARPSSHLPFDITKNSKNKNAQRRPPAAPVSPSRRGG